MRDKILKDIMQAMKDKDKDKLSVLRMVKGSIQLEEIAKKKELSDDDVLGVLAKQIKTRKESIIEFEKAGRNDLIEQTSKEIEILNQYMPEQMSEEEIIKVIEEAVEEVKPQSASDMGKIMKLVSPKFKGKADMSLVSSIIKEKLSNI